MAVICFKIALAIINVVFLLIGVAFIAAGAILAFTPGLVLNTVYDSVQGAVNNLSPTDQFQIFDSSDAISEFPFVYEIGIIFFVLGIFLFAISFLGCCGSCYSCCKILLIVFSVIVLFVMIVEITVFALVLTESSPLHDGLKTVLKNRIPAVFDENSRDPFILSLNIINYNFGCCGIEGVADFNGVTPKSCGVHTSPGCYSKLEDLIQDNLVYAGLGVAGLLLLQLVEVIFAILIFKDGSKVSPT